MQLKINTAQNFIKRVKTFSTNVPTKTANQVIHKQLRLNDYPGPLINRLINRSNQTRTPTQHNEEAQNIQYRSIVNINGLTNKITKSLKTDYPDVMISNKQAKTVKNILPILKDRTEPSDRDNVIYRIPCENCNACYVGMTSNKLRTRIGNHRSNVRKLDELWKLGRTAADQEIIQLKEKTALLEHCVTNQHMFALDRVEILDSSRKKQNLPTLETCHIVNTPYTVNKRTDTDNLSNTYAGILHTLKKTSRHSTRTSSSVPL